MKPDLYTKIVLTVIAVSLAAMTAHSVFDVPRAYASSGPVDVNIARIAGTAVKTKVLGAAEGALPVTTGVDIIGNTLPLVVTGSTPK